MWGRRAWSQALRIIGKQLSLEKKSHCFPSFLCFVLASFEMQASSHRFQQQSQTPGHHQGHLVKAFLFPQRRKRVIGTWQLTS